MTPNFDSKGTDKKTFAPFILHDCRQSKWKDLRLEFVDWDWLREHCGGDTLDDYYLNGPGVEGLVMAVRQLNGLDLDSINQNSEGDACYIHFSDFDEAVKTGEISATMIKDMKLLRQAVTVAKKNGFGD